MWFQSIKKGALNLIRDVVILRVNFRIWTKCQIMLR